MPYDLAPLPTTDDLAPPADSLALTLTELADIYAEIDEQPPWRTIADKEMDYSDGNQLDSELLNKQRQLGIPPAVEDMIGPALRALSGYEVATRTDWRVTADGQPDGQDTADALNYRLNQAERHSGADRACSAAFKPQAACGVGFVEVSREQDPFAFPYRCAAVHRNEIHWDMPGALQGWDKCRWLRRARWLRPERVALLFPDHADLLQRVGRYGPSWWGDSSTFAEGGMSTGLQNAWGAGRAWTQTESMWYNQTRREVCVSEVWYRRWVNAPVLKTRDGRSVEFDGDNEAHAIAVVSGQATLINAIVTRVRRGYWIGPYPMHDGPSPYTHRHFGYAPLWGFREDLTGTPYGYVRGWKYPQDSLNSGVSKLRWGMAVARVERTKGAVAMSDEVFRRQVARADADIVLDAQHMAQPGARFEVRRDYQLTDQHYQMLADNRATIQRTSGVTPAFQGQGQRGSATSGVQESIQVDQSNQSLADLMDHFKEGRALVGDMLLSLIVEDIGDQEAEVIVQGDAITADRKIVLNKTELDEDGIPYLSNDLSRIMLKVGLEDVPSTNSYRAQQLAAMAEAVKSLPPQYQAASMPFLASLMDVPFKRDLIEALRKAAETPDPKAEQMKAANELKARELDLKGTLNEAEIKRIQAQAVQIGVQAAFSAMQAGQQIVMSPQVAPIADVVMQSAGYQEPQPAGVDPNYPTPSAGALPAPPAGAVASPVPVNENTSPTFPPIPSSGPSPMAGIETASPADNLPHP